MAERIAIVGGGAGGALVAIHLLCEHRERGALEIDLIDRDGGTLLRMTHSGLPNAAQCAGHNKGWAHYLGRLGTAAAGRNPGADPGPGKGRA